MAEIDPIHREPENWAEMKEKYLQREEQAVKRAMERHEVVSPQDLADAAKKALEARDIRAPDRLPLKDRTVRVDSADPAVADMKKGLYQDIADTSHRILAQAPDAAKSALSDRKITLGQPKMDS